VRSNILRGKAVEGRGIVECRIEEGASVALSSVTGRSRRAASTPKGRLHRRTKGVYISVGEVPP